MSGLISLQANANLLEEGSDHTESQWRSIVGIVNDFTGVVGVKRSLKSRESSPTPLKFKQLEGQVVNSKKCICSMKFSRSFAIALNSISFNKEIKWPLCAREGSPKC